MRAAGLDPKARHDLKELIRGLNREGKKTDIEIVGQCGIADAPVSELSRAQVALFLPAIYLGGVLMSLPAGWLTDRVGARITLAAGHH